MKIQPIIRRMAEAKHRHKNLKVSQINGKCPEWVDGPEGQCDLEINVMTETKTSKATERDIRGV